jgi:signal peptidase I
MRIGNLEIHRIQGHSMFPSYKENDLILVLNSNHLHPSRHAAVIVHRIDDKLNKMLKRVIGIPNEIVRIESKKIFVNDFLVTQDAYMRISTHSEAVQRSWKLQNNEYFVIGDNLSQSTDSRDFGPITCDEIIGKVILKIWSNRMSRFFKKIFH